jgi:hypothetical protein
MEIAIPLLALGSLYIATHKSDEPRGKEGFPGSEGFRPNSKRLPNTDVPNRNYPDEYPIISPDVDQTSLLSTVNKYDGASVYTDKYFNPEGLGPSPDAGKSDSIYYNLTGQKVNTEYFKHNNMVPFFGSSVRSRLSDDNANEGLMDNMVGTGSQNFSKSEQSPLFSPSDNMQWAYGMPSATDFVQSRMNVSTKMSNVKPFEEEKVRPGLGRDGENSLGFNSGMMARDMWMPKSVDQLRATNNPKAGGLSAQGYEGPAMSSITNRGFHGHVEKNRPDRFAETGSDRYLATTVQGGGLGQSFHSLQVDRDASHRSANSVSYAGAAMGQDATYVDGEYMPTHRQDLGAVPIPSLRSTNGGAREGDYAVQSNKSYTNNRSTANNDDYFGIMGSAIGAVVAPLLDILRPSRKENAVGSMRPYQNATSNVKNSYILNPMDTAPTTIRETTESSKAHYNINSGQNGGGYLAAKHQQAYTTRQDTGDFEYAGVGSTVNAKQQRNYDAEYNQRNNDLKSSTIAGRMVPGNMKLQQTDINQRNNNRLDADLDRRNYSAAASMPYQSPNTNTMGRLAGNSGGLYTGMQMDRVDPMMLDTLKSNPYSHNILGALR